MPIKAPNVGRKTRVGVNAATFTLSGTFGGAGSENILLPITGPKTIKKIVLVTADNSGVAVSLTCKPQTDVAGTDLGSAKDILKTANNVVEWNTADLTASACNIGSTHKGINLLVTAGGAGTWGLRVEVLFTDLANRYGVPTNADVSGIQ